ncbi:MAG: SDR family NAD(P)-dependent oxidoreductase [bacterium]|mgnify:CR=1 FL=1
MNMGKLKGKRVVITGVSRGVGFQIAMRFLAEGAQVLGVARNAANLARAARELRAYGKVCGFVRADVGTPAAGRKVAAAAKRRWGAVDLLINNAAVSPGGKPFAHEGEHELDETLRINVVGPHRMTRALLPLLLKGRRPRVVNVSSGAGSEWSITHGAGMASYRLSKYALNGLTKLYALQLKGKVSVVAMDPGWVKTDMGGPDAPDSPRLSAERALVIALLPFKVTGTYQVGAKVSGW